MVVILLKPVQLIVFGTDEELAFKTNFPSSQHILCTRHLKENAQRQFLKHNVPEEIRNRIISAIFDKTGLIYSDSRISYFERESEVLENFGHVGGKYLQDKLLPTLKEKIFLPSQSNNIIPPDWKNNNCESMNHKITMLGDWKVSKIPNLIDRLRDIHESQLIEIRGALHGRGNLELSDRAKHLRVMHDLWVDMTDEQRRKCS